MKLDELLSPGGSGVMATAARNGAVNTAIYAAPYVIDGDTVAWPVTPGRTCDNLRENPNASFLYRAPGKETRGVRLSLVLARIEDGGKTLESVKSQVAVAAGSRAAEAVRFVAWFKVVEMRPIISGDPGGTAGSAGSAVA